jgi:hypothetical protein
MAEYGTLPPLNRIVGGPASWATMPPVGLAVPSHNRCGQFAPAERWLPPMNQRSHATVEWLSRLLLMTQSNCWCAWCVEMRWKNPPP